MMYIDNLAALLLATKRKNSSDNTNSEKMKKRCFSNNEI